MNESTKTKKALRGSLFALFLCIILLIGTTFAWFTDTASTGVNKIQAGNLDVDLQMKDANGNDMYVHNNQNEKGDRSEYKLGNIIMNSVAEQDIAKIPMTTLQGKEDMAKGQELIDAWNGDFASINPQMYAVGNFSTYYNNFIGEFSTVGKVLYNYVDHQQTMVDGYDDQRLQSEGVASDEELEKMIKYQQAYNASSRYVNVISEMLEHIVTALGS